VVIHSYHLGKLKKAGCRLEMAQAYGEGVVSLSTICRKYGAFDSGRTNLNDEPGSGRPRNRSLGLAILALFETESYTSARYLAEQLAQRQTTILECLHQELHMKNHFFC
jgi:hypothetical protein